MAADDTKLGAVHEMFTEFATQYLKELKAGKAEMNPAFLKTIKDFLKDNNIEATLTPNSPIEELTKEFPFGDETDEVPQKH